MYFATHNYVYYVYHYLHKPIEKAGAEARTNQRGVNGLVIKILFHLISNFKFLVDFKIVFTYIECTNYKKGAKRH